MVTLENLAITAQVMIVIGGCIFWGVVIINISYSAWKRWIKK